MIGGSVLFLGFEGKALTKEETAILKRVRPAGIVPVTRNIGDEKELRQLIADLRAVVPEAILGLDAEGGRVDRLKRIVGPSPAAYSRSRPMGSRINRMSENRIAASVPRRRAAVTAASAANAGVLHSSMNGTRARTSRYSCM